MWIDTAVVRKCMYILYVITWTSMVTRLSWYKSTRLSWYYITLYSDKLLLLRAVVLLMVSLLSHKLRHFDEFCYSSRVYKFIMNYLIDHKQWFWVESGLWRRLGLNLIPEFFEISSIVKFLVFKVVGTNSARLKFLHQYLRVISVD